MGKETFIITGNQTTNSNQYTGVSNNGLFPVSPYNIQYGRVIEVRPDRSIRYELIKDNVNVSAINSTTVATGDAYNFNPNFTRLPEVREIVPIIKGPSKRAGSENGGYDQIDYYMIGPISIQITPDDNKVPKNIPQSKSNDVDNYKLNEVGINKPTSGQVLPVTPTPTPSPTPTPTPTPFPTETPTPTPDPRGTFRENYTNRAGNDFELFSKKSGFNTTIYAYKKGTNNLLVTGSPSSTDSIENLLRIMKLTLQDNIYP